MTFEKNEWSSIDWNDLFDDIDIETEIEMPIEDLLEDKAIVSSVTPTENKQDKWHKFYLKMAQMFAGQSKDPKYKVGGVIVTKDGILYPGYNGDEIGGTNERDSMETNCSGFIHCEANCILKFNPTIHKHSIFYLTHAPCIVCSRMIINTQSIDEVYYINEYVPDKRGIEMLNKRGIICKKISI